MANPTFTVSVSEPQSEREVINYGFDTDPIALYLAMEENIREEFNMSQIRPDVGEILRYSDKPPFVFKPQPRLDATQIVKESHHHTANKIRKHFNNKFVMWTLTNSKPLSSYRQALSSLLNRKEYVVNEDELGLIVTLKNFYDEDMFFKKIKKVVNTDSQMYYTQTYNNKLELEFLGRHCRRSKSSNYLGFYFRDDNDMLYRITVNEGNPLIHIFENFLDDKICINGIKSPITLYGQDISMYNMHNWKLILNEETK